MTIASRVDTDVVLRAMRDPVFFARALVGEPLWSHQREVVTSPARIRCICSGRQAGKSRTLAVCALHEAYSAPRRRVLLLSAGEDAAKDLLAEVSALAQAPLLAGSIVDDQSSLVTLSNGSTVRSIPASEKRARGPHIDLLILDEAAYIDEDVWRAARYTTIAREGSRIIMASTPRGRLDRFFAKHYHLAKDRGLVDEAGVSIESFHWPSSASPLVDEALVEFWRRTDDPRIFEREVLALWADEAGQYFTADELDANVAAFELLRPGELDDVEFVVSGVDWGQAHDANAVVMVGVVADGDLNDGLAPDEPVFFVAFAEARFGYSMNAWARDLARYADPSASGFEMYAIASEANGVGSAPTELLRETMRDRGLRSWRARPAWTTSKRKQQGFGVIKLLLQQNRLLLPREPLVRRQLEALELTLTEEGNAQIAVPSSKGHDDVAMAFMQAASCLRHVHAGRPVDGLLGVGDVVSSPAGVRLLERPRTAWLRKAFLPVRGHDDEETGW